MNESTVLPYCQFACGQQWVLSYAVLVNDGIRVMFCSLVMLWMLHHLLDKMKRSPVADGTLLSKQLAHI